MDLGIPGNRDFRFRMNEFSAILGFRNSEFLEFRAITDLSARGLKSIGLAPDIARVEEV